MNYIIFILGFIIGGFINFSAYRISKEGEGESCSSTNTDKTGIFLGDDEYQECYLTNKDANSKYKEAEDFGEVKGYSSIIIDGKYNARIKDYNFMQIIIHTIFSGKGINRQDKMWIKYFITELTTGVLLLFVYLKFGDSYEAIKNAVLVIFIEITAIIDYNTMEVYDSITYMAMVIGLLNVIIKKSIFHMSIATYILGALVPAIFIYVINKFTNGFGEGDVDVFIIIGLFLGIELSGLTLFFSIIIGALVAIALVLSKKLNKRDAMPFVPYIFVALIITLLLGEQIINYYLNSII